MYAIVKTGGKQYRVEQGTTLVVERLPDDEGATVALEPILFRSEDVVVEHLRGPKIRVFKYKPKRGYKRTQGHRQELTRLEVTELKQLSRKPAAKKQAGETAEAKED
jgi:large subunit ribosomal protein L21